VFSVSGVYGVVAFRVERRTREIGIRSALGASRRQVLVYVLFQSLRPAIGGALIAVLTAYALSQFLAATNHELAVSGSFDVSVYLGAILLVGTSCVVAAVGPTLRAWALTPPLRFAPTTEDLARRLDCRRDQEGFPNDGVRPVTYVSRRIHVSSFMPSAMIAVLSMLRVIWPYEQHDVEGQVFRVSASKLVGRRRSQPPVRLGA